MAEPLHSYSKAPYKIRPPFGPPSGSAFLDHHSLSPSLPRSTATPRPSAFPRPFVHPSRRFSLLYHRVTVSFPLSSNSFFEPSVGRALSSRSIFSLLGPWTGRGAGDVRRRNNRKPEERYSGETTDKFIPSRGGRDIGAHLYRRPGEMRCRISRLRVKNCRCVFSPSFYAYLLLQAFPFSFQFDCKLPSLSGCIVLCNSGNS